MKISRQTKETINMVLFVVVAAALVITYIVYPLNRTKAFMGRSDLEDYNEDSVSVNDASSWVESGLAPDTFWVEADGITRLACLYLTPDSNLTDSVRGTVCLIHGYSDNRDAMLPLARRFLDSAYVVVTYDQRASGRTSGKYRGEGRYEADDLIALISYLELRGRIVHPLLAVGYTLGGDAAILAAGEESRINSVVAIDPYLTSERMQDMLKERHDAYWFPLFHTIMWWWYEMRSGYAAPFRDINDLQPVACRTMLLVSQDAIEAPEVRKLVELSDSSLLILKPTPGDVDELLWELISFAGE